MSDDIILWPDGDWCFREDLPGYGWKSDDFEVVPFGCERWVALADAE